ncbi:MAG: RluA family pseudouridine synthase [Clostridia bacterium]|nr:RluA family pseudouridine synthase [Clostridia bacterium]MBQ6234241.1 RluA family pseudouridine synthase [Clostridia bacterium]
MDQQLTVVYEDNHLLVVLKRPNQLTQSDQTGDSDLLSEARAYIEEKYQKPGKAYLGLVHRMDRPVSGLIVFARTSKAAARLSEQVRTHEMYREYVCVAEGEVPQRFKLVDYLKKDEEANMVRVIPDYLKAEGKLAVLNGVNVRHVDGRSLCAIRLETGRAHQIRVQMAHSGHPLVGDHRYGHPEGKEQIALYGMRLTLTHPTTKERMVFMAPLPDNPIFKPFERDLNGLRNTWPKIGE